MKVTEQHDSTCLWKIYQWDVVHCQQGKIVQIKHQLWKLVDKQVQYMCALTHIHTIAADKLSLSETHLHSDQKQNWTFPGSSLSHTIFLSSGQYAPVLCHFLSDCILHKVMNQTWQGPYQLMLPSRFSMKGIHLNQNEVQSTCAESTHKGVS